MQLYVVPYVCLCVLACAAVSSRGDRPDQRGGDWQWHLWAGFQSPIQENRPHHRRESKTLKNIKHAITSFVHLLKYVNKSRLFELH